MRTFNRIKQSNLLFCLILILSVTCLASCSTTAKKEAIIANEIALSDDYFQKFNLELRDFSVSKRQTNADSKTDYVWITIVGGNEDFEYTADYKAEYILYNEGWLLENCELIDSYYHSAKQFDTGEAERQLALEYENIVLVNSTNIDNEVTLVFKADKRSQLLITHHEITVTAEFKPSTWEITSIEDSNLSETLDIIGEWLYEDNEGRYYYLHISDISQKTVTVKYLFVNSSKSDEWNYISSNGYQKIELIPYYGGISSEHYDALYFHLKGKDNRPAGLGGDIDFGWCWPEENLFTDGEIFCGFTINNQYLNRLNSSNSPVIGIDKTKDVNPYTQQDDTSIYAKDFQEAISILNESTIIDTIEYISSLTKKSAECQELQEKLTVFCEKYSDILGQWIHTRSNSAVETFTISAQYLDSEIILCLESGTTIEGERKLYYLIEKDDTTFVFHSNRFDPTCYFYCQYLDYRDTIIYNWMLSDPSNLTSIGVEYVKKA